MRRRVVSHGLTLVLLTLVLVASAVRPLGAQPFSAQIQQALNQLTNGVITFVTLGMNASSYINWGSGRGATGYGIRDNAGTLQFKNSGGAWANIATLAGGTCTNQVVTAITSAGVVTCTSITSAYVSGTTGTGNFVLATNPILPGTLDVTGAALVNGTAPAVGAAGLEVRNTGAGTREVLALSNLQALAAAVGEAIYFRGLGGAVQGTITAAWSGSATTDGAYMTFTTRQVTTGVDTLRLRLEPTGVAAFNVPLGTSALATVGGVDVAGGGITAVFGADNGATTRTNNTAKIGRLGAPHYANAQVPMTGFLMTSTATDNIVDIGGGTGSFNAATYIALWAAANNTTTNGTEKARLTINGFGLNNTAPGSAIDVNGAIALGTTSNGANRVLWSGTAPTISSGFGTSPSIVAGTSASFRVDVGTGGTASAGVIGMPAATTGWNCTVTNVTATAANRANQRTVQTASTTTTVTVQNQTISTGAALAWTASDALALACTAY